MSDHLNILETAFVKYLKDLPLDERAFHLWQCGISGGPESLYWKLADYFHEYLPEKLAKLLEETNEIK